MDNQRTTLWPSMLAGGGSAVLVLVAYSMITAQPESVAEQRTGLSTAQLNTAPTAQANDSATSDDQRRLALLEQQLAQLANAAVAPMAADSAATDDHVALTQEIDSTSTANPEQTLTPEEARRAALQDWEQKRASFLREPVDQQWAQTTSEMFRADVSALAQERGFAVIQSDCRTDHCAVIVEWPSFEDAVDGFKVLLHHDYQANCARETVLPDPDQAAAGAPYQATVIFDCGDWRQQG